MTTFDREALLSTLTDAAPAVARASLIDGYKNFWFDEKYVYALDGGLGIRLPLETELVCGVPAKPLLDLLKTSALKEVFLDSTGTKVVLQMGKSKVSLVSHDIDLFLDDKGKGLWSFPKAAPKDAPVL